MNRAREQFFMRIEAELALSDQNGPAFVFGVPERAVLHGLAGSAAEIVLHCGQGRLRELRKSLRESFAVPLHGCPQDGEGLPVYDQPCATCVVADLPMQGAEDALERALSMVADGGAVWLLLPRRSAGAEARLRRLLEAACHGTVESVADAPAEMFALRARRCCTVTLECVDEQPAALPVSCIVVTRGAELGLEETLVDLVLRQHYRPMEVFVLDLGGASELDAALFGLAERSTVPVALFLKHGAAEATALQDAIGGVQGRFVHWCHAGARLAPHLLTTLGMALEREDGCALAMAESAREQNGSWSAHRAIAPSALARVSSSERFASEAVLWSSAAVRAAAGPNAAFGAFASRELAWRLLQQQRGVCLPAVVAGHSAAAPAADASSWQKVQQALRPDPKGLAIPLELQALIHLRCGDAAWVTEHIQGDAVPHLLLRSQALLHLGRGPEAEAILRHPLLCEHAAAATLLLAQRCAADGAAAYSALVLALQAAGVDDACWLLEMASAPTS